MPVNEKAIIVKERLRLACGRRRKESAALFDMTSRNPDRQPCRQATGRSGTSHPHSRHDALDLALAIALAGYQCRIARATAVELSLNDYRPFELPLAIPIGRLLLRGDLLEGQRDGFCHVIYGRSSGIANCGSRLCVSITAIRPW